MNINTTLNYSPNFDKKKRRRKNSRRKNGHRQRYSLIKINKIFAKDGGIFAEAKKVEKKEVKKITKEKK